MDYSVDGYKKEAVMTVRFKLHGIGTAEGVLANVRQALRSNGMEVPADTVQVVSLEVVEREQTFPLELAEEATDGPIIEGSYRPEVVLRGGRVFLRDYISSGEPDAEVEIVGRVAEVLSQL
jgi:hypothetical protein